MGENSTIGWTDHTFNPIRSCTWFSSGCKHCYAEQMSHRNPKTLGTWGPFGTRPVAVESYWRQLEQWNAAARLAGRRAPVFCASLADLGEGEPGVSEDEYNRRLAEAGEDEDAFWAVQMWAAEHEGREGPRASHLPVLERLAATTLGMVWIPLLVLSKRPWNLLAWATRRGGWPATWAAGATAENQEQLVARAKSLAEIPAPMRFLSVEPQLGPVVPWRADGTDPGQLVGPCAHQERGVSSSSVHDPPEGWAYSFPTVDWIIQGAESGGAARPMHPAWALDLRDHCAQAEVPFFFKQWGSHRPLTSATSFHSLMYYAGDASAWRQESKDVVVVNYDGTVEKPAGPYEDWWNERLDRWTDEQGKLEDQGLEHRQAWVMQRADKRATGNELDGKIYEQQPAWLTNPPSGAGEDHARG